MAAKKKKAVPIGKLKEVWREVSGSPAYKVSNMGNVLGPSGRILSLCVGDVGYYVVNIFVNRVQKQFRIHRLVATAFIPNPDDLPQVNHKDGVKTNNSVCNLEWVNCKDNVSHAVKIGLVKSGSQSKKTLPVQASPIIGPVGYVYFGCKELKADGFNQGNVSNTCRGRQKTHYGYSWSYMNGA